jgi:hypothetical protein
MELRFLTQSQLPVVPLTVISYTPRLVLLLPSVYGDTAMGILPKLQEPEPVRVTLLINLICKTEDSSTTNN